MESIHILLIVLSIGAVVGSIPVHGYTLESLGVLITGMIFGAYGYKIDAIFMEFGIALFIYGVALQIGPGFIDGFKKNGIRLGLVAFASASVGALTTALLSRAFDLAPLVGQGIYAGTFNNAIALASTGVTDNPNLFMAFGTVYPVTFMLTMVFVVSVPRLLRADLKQEAKTYFEEQDRLHPPPETRCFLVKNPGCFGRPLSDLNLPGLVGVVVSRVVRGKNELAPVAGLALEEDDLVEAVGDSRSLDQLQVVLGQTFTGGMPRFRKGKLVERRFLVTSRDVVGRTLSDLALQARFRATVTRIRRGGVDIPVRRQTQLVYGDRISLVTPHASSSELTRLFGNDLQAFGKQEMYPVLLGMALGSLVGMIPFGSFRLGLSGGVLLVGIVAGRLGKIGPVVFTITAQSNHVLKRLGLILFMAALGTSSGDGLLPNLKASGGMYLLVASAGILLALTTTLVIARWLFRRNLVEVMAICAGSVACTPALELANARAGRDDGAILYAAIYPMGLMAPVFLMQGLIRLQALF